MYVDRIQNLQYSQGHKSIRYPNVITYVLSMDTVIKKYDTHSWFITSCLVELVRITYE